MAKLVLFAIAFTALITLSGVCARKIITTTTILDNYIDSAVVDGLHNKNNVKYNNGWMPFDDRLHNEWRVPNGDILVPPGDTLNYENNVKSINGWTPFDDRLHNEWRVPNGDILVPPGDTLNYESNVKSINGFPIWPVRDGLDNGWRVPNGDILVPPGDTLNYENNA